MRFKTRKYKQLWLVTDGEMLQKGRKAVLGRFEQQAQAELMTALCNLRPWMVDAPVNMGWANETATKTGTERMAHAQFVHKDGKFKRVMEFCNVVGETIVTTNLVSEHWSLFLANKVAPAETIVVEIDCGVDMKQALNEVI